MKAILQRRYGAPADVLVLGDRPRPTPARDQVLIRVQGSSVNPGDWFTVVGRPYVLRAAFGLTRPRQPVPGRDVAGTVEAVGAGVTRWRSGDRVYGELSGGAYAEYALAPADRLAAMPANLDFPDAAAVPLAGGTALQCLRFAGVRAGHRVLVNGASGGIGTFAVQLARSLGAEPVAVCHTRNVDLLRSIGAAEVIDYTRDDFTRPTGSGGERSFDVIVDLIGNHPVRACRRALRPGGVYVASAGRLGGPVLGPIPYLVRVTLARRGPEGRRATAFAAKSNGEDLAALARLIEAGDVRPVIDRRYGLTETAEALAHQGRGHARGKTVISV